MISEKHINLFKSFKLIGINTIVLQSTSDKTRILHVRSMGLKTSINFDGSRLFGRFLKLFLCFYFFKVLFIYVIIIITVQINIAKHCWSVVQFVYGHIVGCQITLKYFPFRSALHGVSDNEKRWLVFGIVLNKVLVDQVRSFLEQEVLKEYGNLKTSHGIDTQSATGRLKNWPTFLKYENINGNDALPKVHGKYNYPVFVCCVTSHVDFAKLYVENFMAKFNAFDEHCDASAVLTLLGKVPVFSAAVQSAASDVRQARNS